MDNEHIVYYYMKNYNTIHVIETKERYEIPWTMNTLYIIGDYYMKNYNTIHVIETEERYEIPWTMNTLYIII